MSGVNSNPVLENPGPDEGPDGPDKSKLASPEGPTSKSPINGAPPLTNII